MQHRMFAMPADRGTVWVIAFLAVLAAVSRPNLASADTDGEICIGPDFVAWHGSGIFVKARHDTVFAVKILSDGSLSETKAFEIKTPVRFNTLKCGANGVQISNTDAVTIAAGGELQGAAAAQLTPFESPKVEARRGVVEIPAPGKPDRFRLVMTHVEENLVRDGGGQILHYESRRVVRVSRSGWQVQSVPVYDTVRLETVD